MIIGKLEKKKKIVQALHIFAIFLFRVFFVFNMFSTPIEQRIKNEMHYLEIILCGFLVNKSQVNAIQSVFRRFNARIECYRGDDDDVARNEYNAPIGSVKSILDHKRDSDVEAQFTNTNNFICWLFNRNESNSRCISNVIL